MSIPPRKIGQGVQVSASGLKAGGSSIPGSNLSAEASAAIAEVLVDISEAVGDVNWKSNGKLIWDKDSRNIRKERLAALGESFSNSMIPKAGLDEWECNEDVAKIVGAAAACAEAVYQRDGSDEILTIPGHIVKCKHWIPPSRLGTIKFSMLFEVERVTLDGRTTLLVAAVRGSHNTADWLVNLNNKLISCSDIIKPFQGNLNTTPPLTAHSGFVECARLLIPTFSLHLGVLLEREYRGRRVNIVFTGHSAGGAVAMLLYSHFLTFKSPKYPMLDSPNVELSCVTFGAPPLFSSDVATLIRNSQSDAPRQRLELAFVNEGDPVPRLDAAYSKVLALLYHKANPDEYGSMSLALERQGIAVAANNTLHLPSQAIFRLGETVMLTDSEDEEEDSGLRLYSLQEQQLDKALWADLFAHKMVEYNFRSAELAAGRFNGRSGWCIEPTGDLGWGI